MAVPLCVMPKRGGGGASFELPAPAALLRGDTVLEGGPDEPEDM